jgi:hypothetical protein
MNNTFPFTNNSYSHFALQICWKIFKFKKFLILPLFSSWLIVPFKTRHESPFRDEMVFYAGGKTERGNHYLVPKWVAFVTSSEIYYNWTKPIERYYVYTLKTVWPWARRQDVIRRLHMKIGKIPGKWICSAWIRSVTSCLLCRVIQGP